MVNERPGAVPNDNWFWDCYWHSDRVASCCGAGGRNYFTEVHALWAHFFDSLAVDAKILDICTGNGAIASIAAERGARAGKKFAIHGIDQATIDPVRYLNSGSPALKQITFHGRTAAERTDFPAHSFDVICGQYALEYTDIDRTIREIARLAKADSRVQFVVHATEGTVVSTARAQIRDTRLLIENLDFFNLARQLTLALFAVKSTGLGPETTGYRQAVTLKAGFEAALRSIAQHLHTAVEPEMFRNSANVIQHALHHWRSFSREQILDKVEDVESKVRAHRARLSAMVAAALDESQARAVATRLSDAIGSAVTISSVLTSANQRLIGWQLVSDHPAPEGEGQGRTSAIY